MAVLAVLMCGLVGARAQSEHQTADGMKRARKEAVQRQRRIMYNDDGCHEQPYSSPEELIALRLRQLAGTQVDTICYCTGGGGLFWGHQPKVGELIGEFVTENDGQYVKDICTSLCALKEQGTDPLKVAVEFGHAKGMEVFWSYRMNNIEDSFAPWSHPRWKREHPDYLLGRAEDYAKYEMTDPRKWWSALNFAVPEVRDYVLRIFEDVLARYDVDGIDMDWFRHPRFFPETTEERAVTSEHIAIMNDFVREVRVLSEKAGAGRGRPLLISCRVPLSVERCLAIGLDVPTWLEEDLVDILAFGGDLGPMAMAPQLQTMVELAHKHHVSALANIGGSGLQPAHGYHMEEAWWAAATNAWHAGVDGIYTFNLFPGEPKEQFSRIGSPDTLKGLDKLYAIDPIQPKDFWGFDRSALVVPDRLPIPLHPEHAVTAILPVGEDIAANAPAAKAPYALLRLRFPAVQGEELRITLNGKDLGSAVPAAPLGESPTPAWFELAVQPPDLCVGTNLVDVGLVTKRCATEPILMDRLELVVQYREK
ncbi:MAG TPA: family 10 glycosylhydrolase [Candidatus Hydrogenedentes bacterium]|nr:family 10 glycosylhydrolase [Candidatus Hydrogenedentota bacterium]